MMIAGIGRRSLRTSSEIPAPRRLVILALTFMSSCLVIVRFSSSPLNAQLAKPPASGATLEQQLLDDLPAADRQLPTRGAVDDASEKSDVTSRSEEAAAPIPAEGSPQAAGEDVGTASGVAVLRRIEQRMEQVQSRMRQFDTSALTQEAQALIVADLTALIEQAERQAPRPQPKPAQKKASEPNAGKQAVGQPRSGTGGDSPDSRKALGAEARAAMLKRAWGHLPLRMRDQIETPLNEQFLPKYEQLIEDFYRRLSEDE